MFDDDNGYPTVTFSPRVGVRYCECGQVRDYETDTCLQCEGGSEFVPTVQQEPTQAERLRFYNLHNPGRYERWER